MRPLTKGWLKAAQDDLLTIEEIKKNALLTYIVTFHSQQCIEKTMKVVLKENQIEIPKIHKLKQLLRLLPLQNINMDDRMLKTLDQLYIESRYPGDFGLLPNGKPTLDNARVLYVCKIYL